MKTSNILFILAIATAILGIRFTESLCTVTMTLDNKPIDNISKFWLKRYDLKVTQELPQPIKHIKVTGDTDKELQLEIHKTQGAENNLFSHNPQQFDYKTVGDSLLIHVTGKYARIDLRQATPVEDVEAQYINVNIQHIMQDKFRIAAMDGSQFFLKRNYLRRDEQDTIGYLTIESTKQANVTLANIYINNANVSLNDAVLSYSSTTQIDSLSVHLDGRSTVKLNSGDKGQQVANISLSGNKQFFKKELLGKDVNINIID
ncbi:hypothetical protein H8B06_14925 [Sphingobacterium sp. DN00404]|uniref:Auto-transporter adhesin head GIN domain-containing protein n=1 Tax=Sphingobacterium micropteri TaxID=2763501 RepID=A0ABR7YS23_9SPHI|nr:hypothetical protein [Sphingobacterium micropteri]MBD1434129.1 hypothetical protein [Sphingobacterium micropteri]